MTTQPPPRPERLSADRLRPVRLWLWAVVVLVFAMIMVGGATRLTGSGLSITEWRPVTGALPPLSAQAWAAEFERYRQISQYELLNKGMSLAEFQFIYWWEWGHRQLGRLIGLVFLAAMLFAMGLLLAMQGAVGWIMVASGLEPGMTAVAPVKLTLHLTLACLFMASLVAMIGRLGGFARDGAAAGRGGAWALLVLAFAQIALGGLVAGSKAGLAYNTWPLMDGALAPSRATLFAVTPWWENFVDNVAMVQLQHRVGAYVLLAFAAWHAVRLAGTAAGSRALSLLAVIAAQAALGVFTLLYGVPLDLGLAHQAGGVLVLVLAVRHLVMTAPATARAPAARPAAA